VRGNVVITPPFASGILESITRKIVLEMATAAGFTTVERAIERTELYVADELFSAGTLSEVSAVTQVDDITVGNGEPGPITRLLAERYYKAVVAPPHAESKYTTTISFEP
jgi:branched-chain amino acid aminotransferase